MAFIEEPPGARGLMGLIRKPKVEGVWFNKKTITLDGYEFVGCRFDGCTLYVYSDNFEITNCFIDDATFVSFAENVIKVIRLFNRSYEMVYRYAPFFAPRRNQDGTISVGFGSGT